MGAHGRAGPRERGDDQHTGNTQAAQAAEIAIRSFHELTPMICDCCEVTLKRFGRNRSSANRLTARQPSCLQPAAPLSRDIDETGGFASPRHHGFALRRRLGTIGR
jgi:hypothetical protein